MSFHRTLIGNIEKKGQFEKFFLMKRNNDTANQRTLKSYSVSTINVSAINTSTSIEFIVKENLDRNKY